MASEKLMKIPYFSKGSAAKLVSALDEGGVFANLDKALFYFATDTKQWILVDVDKSVHVINSYEGEAPTPSELGGVLRVSELPSILDADVRYIYLLDDQMYTFDGSKFIRNGQDILDLIGDVPQGTTVIEYIKDVQEDTVERALNYLDSLLDVEVHWG